MENQGGNMLSDKKLSKLHTNQRLFVKELQGRGIEVEILDNSIELLEAKYNGHNEFILDRDSSINPYAASVIAGDKYLSKKLLRRAGISVTQGEAFFPDQEDDALCYAQRIGYPVVVKPTFGSHGHGVNMDLDNLCKVKDAIEDVVQSIGSKRSYLVEEQFEGKEYRVFITKNGDSAVLHRDPAHVVGDGKRTIEQLANEESHKRMNPRNNCLCPIMLDDLAQDYLKKTGKDFNYIPQNNEKVYLRHNSNVAMGATCEDFTDKVHPSVIEISKQALDVFHGLPYAGMDFLSKDITVEQDPYNYVVVEVNSVPGIHMHMRPGSGKPRNVAKYIVDMMFPETKGD